MGILQASDRELAQRYQKLVFESEKLEKKIRRLQLMESDKNEEIQKLNGKLQQLSNKLSKIERIQQNRCQGFISCLWERIRLTMP